MSYGGFGTEQAMKDYVLTLGSAYLEADPQLLEDLGVLGGIYLQKLVEFHGTTATRKQFKYFKSLGGQCWFKDQPYTRSALRLRHTYHIERPVPTEQLPPEG